MKASRVFIVVIIALMAVILLFELNAPTRFKWDDKSQSYNSKQPFGCYVMDSVLRASLSQGYEVCGSDIDQYFGRTINSRKYTFLFTNNYADVAYFKDVDLLDLIKDGNNVVLATDENYYSYEVSDLSEELDFHLSYIDDIYMSTSNIETLSDRTLMDTIHWCDDGMFGPGSYLVSPAFCNYELKLSSSFRPLATLNSAKRLVGSQAEGYVGTIAGIRNYGKGKFIVVSMPMIFSNYGILDDNIRPLVLRLLSECGNLPIVRYDQSYVGKTTHEQDEEGEGSPLRYLLANRPLRWAFYLALATLVAFVFFSARRRQRVIPVITPPVNHMMDFVKRIGGIYYKRHDNVDLLTKKYATFSNDLRTKAMVDIDIDNNELIDDELQLLSNRTGIPRDELQRQVRDVKDAMMATSISDKRLQQLIDVMNDIMHRINI